MSDDAPPLKRTPFYDFHVKAGGRMVDFAGWAMPVVYRSIVDEHVHTRASASLFDVSHMGRLCFKGAGAGPFLDHVTTRSLGDLAAGRSRYALVCNDAGGTMDDVIVGRGGGFSGKVNEADWSMVCNASNRVKLLAHFDGVRRSLGADVVIEDQTEATAMVALQGPRVMAKLAGVLPIDPSSLKRFGFARGEAFFIPFTVYRSGYTGEDGVELILPAKAAAMAVKFLAGNLDRPDATIKPAGLGARDTLRTEAALPLYGHELSEAIDPISAGLGWAVSPDKEFIGAAALRKVKADGPARRLVGLELDGKRIARQGAAVLRGGRAVGEVTSGTFGPTVQKSIAMAFVDSGVAGDDAELTIDFKGSPVAATIVPLPFYKRPA